MLAAQKNSMPTLDNLCDCRKVNVHVVTTMLKIAIGSSPQMFPQML